MELLDKKKFYGQKYSIVLSASFVDPFSALGLLDAGVLLAFMNTAGVTV